MKKRILNICITGVFALLVFGCTEGFEEMNTDPNRLTNVPYKTIITNAQNSIARTYYHPASSNAVSWCRYYVRNVYAFNDKYQMDGTKTTFDYYSGHLNNLNVAMNKAMEIEDVNTVAIAKILMVYSFQNITDWFGDIPYSEALKADADPPIIYPKYDRQQAIYNDLIAQLKAANNMIDPTKPNIGSADKIFNGNMMKWKRFCNSLLMRLYIRISLVDPTTAKSGIEEIISNPSTYPIITSNSENAFMNWIPGNANYRSPLWINPALYLTMEKVVCSSIIDFLKDRDDTRISVYADPAPSSGEYVGLPLGLLGQSTPNLSQIGKKEFASEDSPTRFMKYSEVLFIIAEAALNGWNVGMTAQEAYEKAIEASFNEFKLAVPAGYLSHPLVDFNGTTPKRELIGDQKWLALYPDGEQGWAEVRRTGYPVYVATEEPIGSQYPGLGTIKRIPYPISEESRNKENLQAAIAAQPGIIEGMFGAGVWWDIN